MRRLSYRNLFPVPKRSSGCKPSKAVLAVPAGHGDSWFNVGALGPEMTGQKTHLHLEKTRGAQMDGEAPGGRRSQVVLHPAGWEGGFGHWLRAWPEPWEAVWLQP